MDLSMAIGVEQDEIVNGVLTPVHFPFDMVFMPIILAGKFLPADWTVTVLLLP